MVAGEEGIVVVVMGDEPRAMTAVAFADAARGPASEGSMANSSNIEPTVEWSVDRSHTGIDGDRQVTCRAWWRVVPVHTNYERITIARRAELHET